MPFNNGGEFAGGGGAGSGGGGGAVTSVFGRTGAVTAASGDYAVSQVTGAAPTASPTFTGTVTLPTGTVGVTQTSGTNNTTLATTAFVQAAISGVGSGTVTSVSVVSANGLAGTVATATTTPAITLSTTVTGVLKGNGTAISAATAGTDYSVGTSSLATGILKSTTSTGALTIAVAGDFPTLNQNTTGTAANLSGTPALPNGTTATTQSAGDATTSLATDAFVTTAVANAIAGVNPAVAVSAATTAAGNTSAWTYNNGASGVGATFTGPVNTAIVIDGVTFNTITTQSLLVKNDTQSPSGAFNGVYVLTTLQTVATGAVFTRRLDYDSPSDMNSTGAIPVVGGTVNALTSWLLTSNVTTVGTSPLTYSQFSLSPSAPVASTFTLSTITADPNPGVVGTYYRTNYSGSGNFTLPTTPATGSWIRVKNVANNTITVQGTVDGQANTFTLTQYQAVMFVYNGTNWDAL